MKTKLKNGCYILTVIFSSLVFSSNLYAGKDGALFFEKVLNKYSTLDSYKDAGEQYTIFYENNKLKYQDTRKFQTSYVKSGKLRFEWVVKKYGLTPKFNILWKKNNDTNVLLWKKEVEKFDNLNSALSSITGITAGISYAIPKYLSSDVPYEQLDGALSVLVKENKPGQTILEIRLPSDRIKTVWIDNDSLLIRKIEWWENIRSYKVKETIIYNDISLNQKINEDIFDVNEKDFVIQEGIN